ncbi:MULTISPECIES: ATP synthase F1 subunit epsilon [unclassified Gemella]|uniref:ATP synthase F1 subunit epsilon n=1 Tax=unclassified Gemella TaxID=2624949 RepID=UPI001D16190A|nr:MULTISPECIES: ATP synthase F1 subunit epsilon [unclassified Gemella]
MATMKVSIATPNGEIYNDQNIHMVSMETHSGSIGIMANHEPLVTTLKIGVLKVIKEDKEEIYFAVSEGFVECHGIEVSILVQTAEQDCDIDKD